MFNMAKVVSIGYILRSKIVISVYQEYFARRDCNCFCYYPIAFTFFCIFFVFSPAHHRNQGIYKGDIRWTCHKFYFLIVLICNFVSIYLLRYLVSVCRWDEIFCYNKNERKSLKIVIILLLYKTCIPKTDKG